MNGYTLYSNLTGRGSAIHISQPLDAMELQLNTDNEACVWATVKLKGPDKLIIGVVFRSPSSCETQNQRLLKTLNEAVGGDDEEYSHVFIMGDFNCPERDWAIKNMSVTEHHPANDFLNMTKDYFLHQHVKHPTHYHGLQLANILDLIFMNEK